MIEYPVFITSSILFIHLNGFKLLCRIDRNISVTTSQLKEIPFATKILLIYVSVRNITHVTSIISGIDLWHCIMFTISLA